MAGLQEGKYFTSIIGKKQNFHSCNSAILPFCNFPAVVNH